MKILLLVAGTNSPSNTLTLAQTFAEGIQRVDGAETEILRLKDLAIEHFTLQYYKKACGTHDDFCMLQEKIERADGIVIASPVWNFSVPGHLKNVIDRIGAFGLDEATHSKGQFNGKPFFFLFAGGAPMIAWKALMSITTLHVSEAMKYYGATVVGRDFEPKAMPGKGHFGLVVNERPKTLSRMRKKGELFARVVEHFRTSGRFPLLLRVRSGAYTWVTRIGNRLIYPVSSQH